MASIGEVVRKFENGELSCEEKDLSTDEQIRQFSVLLSGQLNNVMNQILQSLEFSKLLEQVADSIKRSGLLSKYESMFECALLLAQRGWCIPSSFTLDNIKHCAEVVPEEKLDDVFLHYFCSDFEDSGQQYLDIVKNELLENKQLDDWNPLLVSTLKCVNERDFYIAIPALFSILEGLSWKNFYDGVTRKRKLIDEFQKLEDYEGNDMTLPCLATYSVVEFIKIVFKTGNFSKIPRPERFSVINRDWVMHGVDTPKKWNFSDAVRLVNALHCLISMDVLSFEDEEIIDKELEIDV